LVIVIKENYTVVERFIIGNIPIWLCLKG